MNARPNSSRRGVALLVVLAAVVLCTTVCAGIAGRAAADRAAAEARVRADIAAGLLRASDAPIRDFLVRRSHRAVVPPDSAAPEVPVLHEAWACRGLPVALRITAFDQCGMTPRASAASLVRALPDEAQPWVRDFARHSAPGLDLLPAEPGAFPIPGPTDPVALSALGAPLEFASRRAEQPGIGALVATHNPPHQARGRSEVLPGAVNVNTAPRPLLAAALAANGRGGLDTILRSRALDEPAALPSAPVPAANDSVPRLVGASNAWSFRVDAAAGNVRRSWWVTYTRTSAGWLNAQTIPITE